MLAGASRCYRLRNRLRHSRLPGVPDGDLLLSRDLDEAPQGLDVSGERRGPHRYSRPLHRRREKLHIIDEVVPAAIVDRLAGPGGHNDLEGFVERLAAHPIIDLLTGPRELPGDLVPAQTNAEDEAATSTLPDVSSQGGGLPYVLFRRVSLTAVHDPRALTC